MSHETWTAVDHFVAGELVGEDPELEASLRAAAEAGLPPIAVSPSQGKLLHLLALSIAAERVLEIGTLGGYSTIWMARALPPTGRLVSIEANPQYAELARANIRRAGLHEIAEVRVGRGLDALPKLAAEDDDKFDLIFIDADKPSTPDYFTWALELSHPGSLIIADNVIRDGAVADPETEDLGAQGSRRLHKMLAREPRVSATTIQTVGIKGYDGFTLALVLGR